MRRVVFLHTHSKVQCCHTDRRVFSKVQCYDKGRRGGRMSVSIPAQIHHHSFSVAPGIIRTDKRSAATYLGCKKKYLTIFQVEEISFLIQDKTRLSDLFFQGLSAL